MTRPANHSEPENAAKVRRVGFEALVRRRFVVDDSVPLPLPLTFAVAVNGFYLLRRICGCHVLIALLADLACTIVPLGLVNRIDLPDINASSLSVLFLRLLV